MPIPNSVAQGISESFAVQLRGQDGEPFTGYTGAEDLAGSIRIGQDFPSLIDLVPTWISGPSGTISVPVPAAATATLDVGRYWIELHLADSTADLYEGWLEVTYSPGAAAALVTYGDYQSMLDIAPAIEKFARSTDLAGFARQQQDARFWFEDLLYRHHKSHDDVSTDRNIGWLGFGYTGPCRSTAVVWRDGRRSPWLEARLAAGALVVTDPIRKAVTCYAVALLYDRQAMTVKDGETYAQIARKWFARAENWASNTTAELIIDANTPSERRIVIRLGVVDTLDG